MIFLIGGQELIPTCLCLVVKKTSWGILHACTILPTWPARLQTFWDSCFVMSLKNRVIDKEKKNKLKRHIMRKTYAPKTSSGRWLRIDSWWGRQLETRLHCHSLLEASAWRSVWGWYQRNRPPGLRPGLEGTSTDIMRRGQPSLQQST